MKKFLVVTLGFILAVSASLFVACTPIPESSSSESSKEESSNPIITTYEVAYGAGGALGEAPATQTVEEGTVITLIENPFTNEGYTFKGWLLGETLYQAGDSFTVNENATFVASWEEIVYNPHFLQESYAYDRWAAGDLELTLDLDRTSLIYVELNGEMLFSSDYSYDSEKQCLVIVEDVMLTLVDGEYSVIVYTDAAKAENPTCKITVDNSVKTSFDEVTLKSLRYGYEEGVTFEVEYDGCTVKEIKHGERVVPDEYYEVLADGFTLKAEYLKYLCGETAFTVVLTNNDAYDFAINSNVLFATDYDINTIHNTAQSNVGHNPLYQYTDNVSIVDGPNGMSGKVLKITPNTTEVQYDCNGYITLASLEYIDKTTWYNVGFAPGKFYAVTFDYLTEGTSVGTFAYKDPHSSWNRPLLLGAENDGIVHNFKAFIRGDELKHGLYLYANFIGGGGCVYVDNFRVVELEALPTLSDNGNYNLIGDYSFNFDATGLKYEVKLGGEFIETVYDQNAKTLTIKEEVAKLLEAGDYTLTVETAFGVLETTMRVVDNRDYKAEVSELTHSYIYNTSDLVVEGTFKLVEITEAYLSCDVTAFDEGNYDYDQIKNAPVSISYITMQEDKLVISKELLDKCYGEATLAIHFSNGEVITLIINSNVVIFSDYDLTHFNMPLGSSINGYISQDSASMSIANDENDNKFLRYCTNDCQQGHAVHSGYNYIYVFNTNWGPLGYYVKALDANKDYVISFDYKVVNTAGNDLKYYFVTADQTEAGTKHYLSGNSGTFSMKIIGGDTNVSRFGIGCDLPAAPDCYLAIDNYRIVEVEKAKTYDYAYGSTDLVINGSFANKSVASVARRNSGYIGGSYQFDTSPASVDSKYFTVNDASLVISKTLLDMFYGTTNLIVTFTDGSDFELNVKSNSVYFTNFDETFVHMPFTTEGGINGYITQDSAQLKLYEDNGNHLLRYCTAEAYHGHSSSQPWNFVMLFNTIWSGKGDYCQIMESGKSYEISFDYRVINAEGQNVTYSFVKENSAGQHTREAIDSTANSFTTTIQAGADVHRIAISTDQIGGAEGCYMLIDNYRITEIA